MPRANVKDKRRGQLIAAALDSISKRGLQETTITHISKGAGMSRGIVNFYFNSKEMMLREALKTLLDDYQHAWRDALDEGQSDAALRLQKMVLVHFSKKLCSAKRLNVMSAFWGQAASQSAYRNQLEAADMAIKDAFTEALAHAYAADLEEARQHAGQLHALIRGFWLAFMLNPKAELRELYAAECQLFLDRVAGAPVRIVRDNADKKKPKAEAKRGKREDLPGQMDLEDLFGSPAA
jgi:AcrR family transcriptional regulator